MRKDEALERELEERQLRQLPVGCATCGARPGQRCMTTRRSLYGAGFSLSFSQTHKQRRLDIEAFRRALRERP